MPAGARSFVSTDAGLPHAAGSDTSFRVQNVGRDVRVLIDDRPSEQWAVVDGELEITTDGRRAHDSHFALSSRVHKAAGFITLRREDTWHGRHVVTFCN